MFKHSLSSTSMLSILLAVIVHSPMHAGEADDLRVWELRPGVFDYMFTSVLQANKDKTVLSLKHRNGELTDVPVGGTLGDYTLKKHVVTKAKVYKESIAAEITQETHSIVLSHKETEEELELVRGNPLDTDDKMARLIDSRSRQYWLVKEGDVFSINDRSVEIISILGDEVRALAQGGVELVIPFADVRDRELYTERVMAYREAVRDIKLEQEKERRTAVVAKAPAPPQPAPEVAPAAPPPPPAAQAPVIHNHIYVPEPDRNSINVLAGGISPQYLYPPTLVTDGQIFTPISPYPGHGGNHNVTTTRTTIEPARTDIRSIHVKPTVKTQSVTTSSRSYSSRPRHGAHRSSYGGSSFRFSYQDDEFGIRGRF